jgi:Bacteriophage tail sheath protein
MPTYLSPGVYVEEVSSGSKPIEGVGTAVAAFVGFAQKGPLNEPCMVTNWTQFTQTFGDFIPGSYLAHSVYGYFLNGGGTAYVVRVGPEDSAELATARAEIGAGKEGGKPALTVRALEAGPAGDDVSVEVVDAPDGAEGDFKLIVRSGKGVEEVFEDVSLKPGANNVATKTKSSKLVAVEVVRGTSTSLPVPRGQVALTGGGLPPKASEVTANDYVGNSADRTGFAGLEAIDEVTMLCVPDLMAAHEQGVLDAEGVKAVQLAIIAHCELMSDRVAILDPPPSLNAQKIKEWREDFAGYDSKYATLYWPWIKIMDPLAGKPRFVPPSGHMAGIWARSDDTRGVHKAPANEVIRGVLSPELQITKGEHDQLNPGGINCIRAFPGQGIRVWGARTLSSDPEWRYLNVRRLFNYIEESILQGTNWVVFEPNDPKLWDSVRRTITMFLRRVWRDGALFGRTPAEAFFVKCDEENNPAENRDVGILTVDVGIAPVKPAEFVVFRISQFSGGAGLED